MGDNDHDLSDTQHDKQKLNPFRVSEAYLLRPWGFRVVRTGSETSIRAI